MKKYLFLILLTFLCHVVKASDSIPVPIKVWQGMTPPSENGLSDEAELFVYLPQNPTNAKVPAVLIFPGGGYAGVSMQYEGHAFGQWLASKGYIGVVLKYRLPNQHKGVPMDDAVRSLQIISENADKWNVDTSKIGVAGFSAGGHLAAAMSTYYPNNGWSIRPDFTILFYPVISFEEVTRGGTRNNLLGLNPPSKDIYAFSLEKQVIAETPPAIILVCDDDASVPPNHSTAYYNALKDAGVDATLYVFPEGGHGWGLRPTDKYYTESLILLEMWLKRTLNN